MYNFTSRPTGFSSFLQMGYLDSDAPQAESAPLAARLEPWRRLPALYFAFDLLDLVAISTELHICGKYVYGVDANTIAHALFNDFTVRGCRGIGLPR